MELEWRGRQQAVPASQASRQLWQAPGGSSSQEEELVSCSGLVARSDSFILAGFVRCWGSGAGLGG